MQYILSLFSIPNLFIEISKFSVKCIYPSFVKVINLTSFLTTLSAKNTRKLIFPPTNPLSFHV